MRPDISWIMNIKEKTRMFIDHMQEDNFAYFQYSYSGDKYNHDINWGLGNLVFAVKILYMTGLLEELTTSQIDNLHKNIIKFSSKDGYISDPLITELSLLNKIRNKFGVLPEAKFNQIENRRRAETRQSFAALCLLGRKPKVPFASVPDSEQDINSYLSSFSWHRPWDAGSHFSHLLFFLRMNEVFFPPHKHVGKMQASETDQKGQGTINQQLIDYAVDWVNKLQSPDDGCWYQGEAIETIQKINGAMKVLTGLHAAGIYEFSYPDKLIDIALSTTIYEEHACNNFNMVYVLYCCSNIKPEYRKLEIEEFLIKRIILYKEFYHKEGGFSFYKNKSNDIYYGRKISQSKNEPDMHGTLIFIWGLSIISKIINLNLNFKIPIS